MAKYQVAVVARPAGWVAAGPDDAPPGAGPGRVIAERDELFAAVREAVEHNQAPARQADDRWAVVLDPASRSRSGRGARLCTPIAYKVAPLWRPEGWEPTAPLDVPRCQWPAESRADSPALPYAQAVETVRSLNQQSMDRAATLWYVLVAVENEPLEESVAYDPGGTETVTRVRKLHVVRPQPGGPGDCSHCPAHALPCAAPSAGDDPQTLVERQVRAGADRAQ